MAQEFEERGISSLIMSLNPTHLYKSSSKHYPFTLRHDSLFKAIWDWIILLLVIYTAIEIPYSAAFLLPHQIKDAKRKQVQLDIFEQIGNSPHYACNIFVDVMFIIDILINFRTTYVDEECEELISNPKRIALRYFKSWFIVDFVAAIPFELITMGGNTKDEATLTLIGLLKTARLLRLVRVSRKLDRYSEYGVSVLFLLMSLFTLAAHWLACIWYAIGYNELSNQAGWLRAMSRQLDIPHNGTDSFVLNTHYITALYFTLSSLTSVGFGNISPNTNAEKLFSVCVMLIGALMYASIFGNLTAIIQRLYSSTARYHRDMRLLREFITFHKIPKHLKETLEEYAKHEWSYTKGVEIDDVLKRFPESLQTDVYYHMYGALFKTFSAFDQASEGCQRALARCLKTRHYLPGHYIIHQGDELADYHFVDKGSIQVICDDQPTLSLNKGDFISCDFNSYLHTPKANASLQANSLCDVIFLSWTDVQTVLHAYPEFRGPFTSQLEVAYNLGGPDTSKKKGQYGQYCRRTSTEL